MVERDCNKVILYPVDSSTPYSRAAKHIHCAQNVKTMGLCIEFNKPISNVFQICHIPWHFHDSRHVPWGFAWFKNWNMLQFLLNKCQIVCLVIRIPKMYSLTHPHCLVFNLHKVIGQMLFQICTWGKNSKLLLERKGPQGWGLKCITHHHPS